MKMTILCPAKINTFLSVGPPDHKGWHPLRTVFQTVELADVLTVHFGHEEPGVFSSWPDLPRENTLTKTLRLVEESAALPALRVELEKKIPVQSGLGGGSSDAAGLLKILQAVFPEALPDHFMKEIAFSVGADVPFFLAGGRARGEGYGDKLTPLPDEPKEHLVIVQPEARVSTPDAYRLLDSIPRKWAGFDREGEVINDFELTAPPECLEIKARLKERGARSSMLTGSGSAVFGLFGQDKAGAQSAHEEMSSLHPVSWIGQTLLRDEI